METSLNELTSEAFADKFECQQDSTESCGDINFVKLSAKCWERDKTETLALVFDFLQFGWWVWEFENFAAPALSVLAGNAVRTGASSSNTCALQGRVNDVCWASDVCASRWGFALRVVTLRESLFDCDYLRCTENLNSSKLRLFGAQWVAGKAKSQKTRRNFGCFLCISLLTFVRSRQCTRATREGHAVFLEEKTIVQGVWMHTVRQQWEGTKAVHFLRSACVLKCVESFTLPCEEKGIMMVYHTMTNKIELRSVRNKRFKQSTCVISSRFCF